MSTNYYVFVLVFALLSIKIILSYLSTFNRVNVNRFSRNSFNYSRVVIIINAGMHKLPTNAVYLKHDNVWFVAIKKAKVNVNQLHSIESTVLIVTFLQESK